MSEWSGGYVSELGYTFGYYEALSTSRIDFCMLNQGLAPPKISRALELGFGQGLSINIHAAATDVAWTGTDFNPVQANFARQLAKSSGADIHLYDSSFEELLHKADLPTFQYIGLHGIWSWISDKNRQAVVEIIRDRLEVGGVVYMSYNTLPGWSGFAPMRDLMKRHSEILAGSGAGVLSGIEGAFGFAQQLLDLKPKYLLANPQMKEWMGNLQERDRHYIAHEFFNKDWQPMLFAEVADALTEAKLEFAGSAEFTDHVHGIHFSPQQRDFLAGIPDISLRETVKDFMLNKQFRQDLWVKGPLRLTPSELNAKLRNIRFVLKVPVNEVSLSINGGLGEISLNLPTYQPIIDFLSNHEIKSLGQIENHFAASGMNLSSQLSFGQLKQAMILLVGSGQVGVVQPEAKIKKAMKSSQALNNALLDKALSGYDLGVLASPVTAGGVKANRFQQLFLDAIREGISEPDLWAEAAWRIFSAQGVRLTTNDKTLDSKEENITELKSLANDFAQSQLATFRALGVA